MAGTLLLLREAGWEIHYLNVSTRQHRQHRDDRRADRARPARRRRRPRRRLLGAKWHAPFCDDLAIFYTEENIRRLCAVVRAAQPTVVLTHALADYMEDHMITARLAVTATFARGIPNYRSQPAAHARRSSRARSTTRCRTASARRCANRCTPEIFVDTTQRSRDQARRARLPCLAEGVARRDARAGQLPRDDGRLLPRARQADAEASSTPKAGRAICTTASALKTTIRSATSSAENISATAPRP